MAEHDARITIVVDGEAVRVRPGVTVAVALLESGRARARDSVSGAPRGPLCGVGACFECRVVVDGRAHRRSCRMICTPGMEVQT